VECLRYDINIDSKKLKETSGKAKKVPLSVKMALRNTRLKPVRTLMASLGIAGCVALLLCGFGIGDTLNFSTSNDLDKVFKYDVTTTYSNQNFESELADALPELEYYEKYERFYAEVSANNKLKNMSIYQIAENSTLSSISLSGEEVAISKSLANDLGVKVGDKITLSISDTQKELTISKIIETSFFNGVYVCSDLGFSSVVATHGMWIKLTELNDDSTQKINAINGTNTAYTRADLKDNVENKISSIGIMTTTLEFFAISLAIVVLLNLIFLILKERIREIATLKVLGKTLLSIGLSLFFEILFMSLLGTALGLVLGYPLLVWVLSINKVEVMNFLYHINVGSYFVSIAIIFVTIVLVSLFCLIKVKKINMIESLKSVE
jgi:putative ABC transport system permease protein